MYIVHMKRVTASEARRNWFRILDEVAAGATVVIERAGRRILLKREDPSEAREQTPDYGSLIRASSVEEADRWGWSWEGDSDDDRDSGELTPVELP